MPLSKATHEAIGQLICPTLFHGGARGATYDATAAAELLDRYGWGGYIVFKGGLAETRDRVAALQARARVPLLVAADMESGAGQQVAGLSVFPPLQAFGALDDPQAAYDLGAWTAREALSVGVNWILGPVADVTNNPLNPIINLRSFGGEAQRVAALVAAFVRGCQAQGALACAKHFPGHGDTATDSHSALGRVEASRERLEAVEFPPFRAAIASDVAAIMTAHLAVPALDAPDLPATLGRAIVSGLLRETWGYDGLVVTDALTMGGITAGHDPAEAAVLALAAGCDLLLMPPDPVATFEAIARALAEGRLAESRVLDAARRVALAKARLAQASPAAPPARLPGELASEVATRALTLARGELPRPWPVGAGWIAVDDGAETDRLEAWQAALAAHGQRPGLVAGLETDADGWQALDRACREAPVVVFGVFSPIRVHKDRSLLSERLLAPLRRLAAGRQVVVVAFSSPFLVAQFPAAAAWLLTFGTRPEQIAAAVSALVSGTAPPGRSPVLLPERLAGETRGRQDPEERGSAFA